MNTGIEDKDALEISEYNLKDFTQEDNTKTGGVYFTEKYNLKGYSHLKMLWYITQMTQLQASACFRSIQTNGAALWREAGSTTVQVKSGKELKYLASAKAPSF